MMFPAMNGGTVLAMIDGALAEGRTVTYATVLTARQFTPKAVARLRAAGVAPFKVGADGTLRMLDGYTKGRPRYVVISTTSGMMLGRLDLGGGQS